MDAKQTHELEVFRGFVAASRLSIDDVSIEPAEPPNPDIRCVIPPHGVRLFELAEILWEDPDPDAGIAGLAHGFALSQRAGEQKAAMMAAGRLEDAQEIQTWGEFELPPLASLLQVLQKKCARRYRTDGRPVSLLLYYERQTTFEPFERLTDYYRDTVHALLAASQFSDVWLYHHAIAYTLSFSGIQAGSAAGSVPTRNFETPESQRRVIGHIATTECGPLIFLDASYIQVFSAASDALAAASRRFQASAEFREDQSLKTRGPSA